MSNDISLAELQEFIAEFWYHYDEAHFGELAERFADDVHYITRSDTGASPFEELLRADVRGRDETMAWMVDHRNASPYPLRHMAINVFRTGVDGDAAKARFYLLVCHTANSVPFVNSTAIVDVAVARRAERLQFTSMEVVLDTQESVPLSQAANSAAAG
ncbi:MAG TPA: nuclear transport factor 2 family protein [Mycobacterium sp.]|nr:nuclear transport factor 2 family protein [Mycobacterium sp.]